MTTQRQNRVFASLYPYVYIMNPFDKNNQTYGANIAAHNFLSSLLKYGDFDEFHFVSVDCSQDFLEQQFHSLLLKPDEVNRIKFIPWRIFLEETSLNRYSCIYTGDSYFLFSSFRTLFQHKLPPIIGHIHSFSYNFWSATILNSLFCPVEPWDGIICSSPTAFNIFQELLKTIKSSLNKNNIDFTPLQASFLKVPLGIDVFKFKQRPKDELRNIFGIPKDAFVILSIGRMSVTHKMDPAALVQSFSYALNMNPSKDARLIVISDVFSQTDKDYLYNYINILGLNSKISIINDVSESTKPLWYSLADIHLSLSDNYQETYGLTILEAMASGLPVIATDWGGYKHLIQHNVNGFLVPSYTTQQSKEIDLFCNVFPWQINHLRMAQNTVIDIEATGKFIFKLIQDEELKNTMGKNARNNVLNNYSFQKTTRDFCTEFRKLEKRFIKECKEDISKGVTKEPFLWKRSFDREFSSYPTKLISCNSRIAPTNFSSMFDNKSVSIKHLVYPTMTNFLDTSLLESMILSILKIDEPVRIEDFIENLKISNVLSGLEHILWLAKHGFLTLLPEE